MTVRDKVKDEGSTRALLVNSTERIMLEDGYAAVTYRNVAAKAGVSLGAVQYHFPSLDDLFSAVVRQYAERTLETMAVALRANPEDVLRILWENSGDEISTALLMEIIALANHRKSIQMEIAQFAERFRKVQLDALTEHWENLGFPEGGLTPAGMAFLLTCMPRWMRLEASFKLAEEGHAEVRRLVEHYLDRVQPALDSLDHRKSTPRLRRLERLDDSSVSAVSPLRKRAASSAKALMHYTRMAWTAWAQRDGEGTTDRH